MGKEVYFTKKEINETIIAIIADIHYSPHYNQKILNSIIKQIDTTKPDYLIVAGDILDKSNYDYKELLNFFEKVSKITTIIAILGNHDTYIKGKDGKSIEGVNEDFVNSFKSIKNTYLLRDEKIIFNNICFYGFDLSFYHYIKDKESYPSFCKEIEKLNTTLDPNNYNITLIHSPVNIYEYIKQNPTCNLAKSDLVISGHTHNGVLPYWFTNILNKAFKTNRSLASPYQFLFPKYAQGRVFKPVDGYIYEGLKKLSYSSGILSHFDFIFHKRIKIITIKKEKTD